MEGAKPGHTVQFQGLKGAAHLNGTEGTLVKYLKKEARWSVRCDNDDGGATIVKAKPENLVRKYVKPKQVTKKDYDMKSFDALFRKDGDPSGETTKTTNDVTDFRSILSPVDGMPPLWPSIRPSGLFIQTLQKNTQLDYHFRCFYSLPIKELLIMHTVTSVI